MKRRHFLAAAAAAPALFAAPQDADEADFTSLFDGRLVPSCLVLAAEANGRSITTIEGLGAGGALHPLQQKFLEHAALQCGICTPGFLVAAKALLDKVPSPTEQQVRFWLAGNLCRCTGYDKIIRAVMDAADEMRAVTV